MIVVSDTSPIRALAYLGLLTTLEVLFADVLVPPAVVRELSVDVPGVGAVDVGRFPFLTIAAPTDQGEVDRLAATLGRGESEALVLAAERRCELELMDDGEARVMAKRFGLTPLGVLGVLARAKDVGRIEAVAPLIDRLVAELGFRVSPQVRQDALRLAGEQGD